VVPLGSLDIESELTNRAREIFKNSDISNIRLETRDGREGFESAKQYDRIIAWTTPDEMLKKWIEQLSEGGLIFAPFSVRDMVQ
jgi:protein-L-isoaspartate(D-aspartate) O-methyltransferase